MSPASDQNRDRVARLLWLAHGCHRGLIAAQDHPDPDGMASAAALKRILRERANLDVVIAASGEPGRPENRATLQYLGETFEDLHSLDLAAFDLRALVDTQPGFTNNSWPPDVPAHLVIDHHPRGQGIPPDCLADIRPDYGANSTILTEYLRAADIEPDPQLATALLYGIKSDTQNLSRDASQADTFAFLYLYPLANHRLLAKIERERLPRDYFATLARALHACRIYGPVALCALGPIASPDVLGELADLFLRLEGIRWVLCHGLFEGTLHASVRTILRQGNAGALMSEVMDGLGQGGGHDMMAGGQAPLDAAGPDAIAATVREVELRFLRLLEVRTRTPRPLVAGPQERAGAAPASEPEAQG